MHMFTDVRVVLAIDFLSLMVCHSSHRVESAGFVGINFVSRPVMSME